MALRRCTACDTYTLEGECSSCGGATERAGPTKYSPEDRYGPYRRALKKEARQDG